MTKRRAISFALSGAFCLIVVLALASFLGIRRLGEGISTADVKPLRLALMKAAVDNLLLTKQSNSSVVPPTEYESKSFRDPQALANDEKLFNTWQTGTRLAETALKTKSGDWVSSSMDLSFLPSDRRVDGWGHSYCVLRRGETALIMSAGPKAAESPACKNIRISEQELSSLPHARMLETPSGNLIVVLTEKPRS